MLFVYMTSHLHEGWILWVCPYYSLGCPVVLRILGDTTGMGVPEHLAGMLSRALATSLGFFLPGLVLLGHWPSRWPLRILEPCNTEAPAWRSDRGRPHHALPAGSPHSDPQCELWSQTCAPLSLASPILPVPAPGLLADSHFAICYLWIKSLRQDM